MVQSFPRDMENPENIRTLPSRTEFSKFSDVTPEFRASENRPVLNPELHVRLRIIPQTFEVALPLDLRLSL
jgi:hypothetical protein